MTKAANQISLAVENAKLHEQTRQDLLRTRALYQISKAIQSAADLETLMDSIIHSARTALAAHWVIAYKVDFKRRRIEHVAVTHSRERQLQPLDINALSEGLNGWCIANQEPVLTGKDLTDRRESPTVSHRHAPRRARVDGARTADLSGPADGFDRGGQPPARPRFFACRSGSVGRRRRPGGGRLRTAPAAPRDRTPGLSRRAYRPAEPAVVQRPARPGAGPSAPQRTAVRGAVYRFRRLQTRQR